MDTKGTESPQNFELLWGADRIAQEINLTTRQTYHQLETGAIPAKKVGGKWVAERGWLRAFFTIRRGLAK